MTTIHFNHSAHIELWTWLADNSNANKRDWPGWSFNGGSHFPNEAYCFACEACVGCEDCPINWPGGGCQKFNSPFNIWRHAKARGDHWTAYSAAVIISRLPLRTDINVAVY